jgi:hypothetical protein
LPFGTIVCARCHSDGDCHERQEKDDVADEAVKDAGRFTSAQMRQLEAAVKISGRKKPAVTTTATDHPPRMVAILLSGNVGDDRMEIYRAVRNGFPLQSVLNMIENSEVYNNAACCRKSLALLIARWRGG